MKVLVTGSAGMLAKDLIPCLSKKGHQPLAPPEDKLNITNLRVVRESVDEFKPEIIINCAAYTKVDDAENQEHLALIVNGLAFQSLCVVCQEGNIPLVHFSTDYIFVRSSCLFGLHGKNFIETMLELGQKQKQVSVVTDQKGCPTWTRDLAEATVDLVETERYGIYHITNSEPTTWFDFTREIFHFAGLETEVLPVTSEQFLRPARRPQNSVLDS